MKKLLATILALVMAIGVTTTAWADDEGTTANIAKIGETGYATLADAIAAGASGRDHRAAGECCDKFQHSDHEECVHRFERQNRDRDDCWQSERF